MRWIKELQLFIDWLTVELGFDCRRQSGVVFSCLGQFAKDAPLPRLFS